LQRRLREHSRSLEMFMNSSMKSLWFGAAIILAILPGLSAARKAKSTPSSAAADSIAVVGHMELARGPVVNLVTAVHWRRNFLYIEHGAEGAVTIVDVSNPAEPKASGEFVPPAGSAPFHLDEVTGTAAMFTGAATPHAQAPQTVVIMNFEDPAHPRIEREFSHVSCLIKDAARGLIYLTNEEGLWVLRPTPAPDRRFEEEYDKYIRYSH
jgi:hypothetical protein